MEILLEHNLPFVLRFTKNEQRLDKNSLA